MLDWYICVTEDVNKAFGFDNHELIHYTLRRDIKSKQFPALSVDFYYKGNHGNELFGVVKISSLNCKMYSPLTYVENVDQHNYVDQ